MTSSQKTRKTDVVRVLCVEDQEEDYVVANAMLSDPECHLRYAVDWARSYDDALAMIRAEAHDIYLVDHYLGDRTGVELLKAVVAVDLDAPVIVLTASEKDVVDYQALEVGAADFLQKGNIDSLLLDRTIRYAIARKHTQSRLRDYAVSLDKLNHQLTQRSNRLEEMNREINRFLGIAAHDLRTPLNVIMGFSRMLTSGKLGTMPENQVKFLTKIAESSHFMLQLVDDFLDISNIEAGCLKLSRAPVDLSALIEENVLLNRSLAVEKNIAIDYEKPERFPPVQVDAAKIDQVLNNLLSNAVKFSHPDTRVTVRLELEDRRAAVHVADCGQGVPEEERDQLFKPFPKTSVRATAGERSTGLGLVIAKKIIEGHGGSVDVSSAVGKGSTFTFRLPIETPE